MLEATLQKTGVDPADVGDVVVGSVLGPSSQRANESRIAMFLAGFPDTVPCRTVNRQCSSGLQAVADIAAGIRAGFYQVGIAAGVETMSINPMKWEGGINPRVEAHPAAKSCLVPMGITSENVAVKYGIDRATQVSGANAARSACPAPAPAGAADPPPGPPDPVGRRTPSPRGRTPRRPRRRRRGSSRRRSCRSGRASRTRTGRRTA